MRQRLCSKPARGSCPLPWTQPAGGRGAGWAVSLQQPWGQRLEWMGEEELGPARTGREGVAAEVRLTVNKIWEHKSRRIWLGVIFSVRSVQAKQGPIPPWSMLQHCVLFLQRAVKHQTDAADGRRWGKKYVMPSCEGSFRLLLKNCQSAFIALYPPGTSNASCMSPTSFIRLEPSAQLLCHV